VILWYERGRLAGVRIGWRTFALTGLVTAAASTAAAAALIRWVGGRRLGDSCHRLRWGRHAVG
jgi:hypothetical protein